MHFKASVSAVMIRSGILVVVLCLLIGLALTTDSRGIRIVAGTVSLLLATYHFNRIVALARLKDSITLTNEALLCKLLYKKKDIPYNEIVSIKAGSSLINGIHYKITTKNNDLLIITNVIENHLSLYNKITRLLREKHKQ